MSVIRRSLQYLRKYAWLTIGAFLGMIVMTVASLLIPSYIQSIIDDGIVAQNIDVIRNITVTLIVIAVVEGISSFCKSYWSQKSSQGIAYDIRNQLYEKLEHLEFSFHDKYPIGQLMTRATSDVEAVRNFYATGLLQMLSAVITLFGALGILFYTNVQLTLYALIVIPVVGFVFFRLFKALAPFFASVQQNLGKLNNILQQNIEGVRVVKSFTAEHQEGKRYGDQNRVLFNENLKVIKLFSNNFPLVFFLTNVMMLISIWIGGGKVVGGTLSLGALIAFNTYLTYLLQPIFQLGMISQQLSRATASSNRIFEIIDIKNTIDSKPGAVLAQPDQPFEIQFRDVSFRYSENTDNVIFDVNLEIPSGSTLAILGNTGSGKSTLTNLIPRFYDATEGKIMIDGINVKDYEVNSLRKQIGVVLQDIRLLHSTIRENITFGNPNATEEQIQEVIKIAQIDDFINSLPEGLDYVIGEGAGNISGGQRQRIAIARMLLISPSLLILDDALSALDAATEFELRKELSAYLEKKAQTAIIISQKVSTVRNADQIILMHEGHIVDQGTHDELMRVSDMYRNLYYSQTEEEHV